MPFQVPPGKNRFAFPQLLQFLSLFLVFVAPCAWAQTPAFPGAQGFGQNATGGRNGTVYHVTSLNDSGTGSFRDAVSKGNRTIVFDVGGTINLASAVSCSSGLTIAGQTAPGGGIAIVGHEVSFSAKTNEIVRFLRIRPGSIAASTEDGINLGDGTNMIFDHISVEFAPYNSIDAHGNFGANQITFQSCMLADPIGQQFNAHTEALNNTFAWCYNIFASAHNRNPLAKVNTIYINNVVYNYQAGYTVANTSGNFTHDIINNYFITGPSTTSAGNDFYQMDSNQQIYSSGNLLDSNNDGKLNGGATAPSGVGVLSSPWSSLTPNIPTFSTVDGYKYAVSLSGALPRDQVDHLVVADITSLGTSGRMWTSQTQTGLGNNGYGTVNGGPTPINTSGDGIADYWKLANGLNVNTAYPLTNTADGYTLLEHYLNWLAAPHALANTNTAVTIDLTQYTAGFSPGSTYTITGTSNGVATLTNSSSVIFTPNNNLVGIGGFTFTVSDGVTTLTNTVGIGVTPISIPLDLTWRGDGALNNWDVATTNWLNNGTNPAAFAQDDTVTFDDTGSNTPAINLVGSLIPADITINATQNYTFSGTGSYSGSAPFTKSGPGTLTVNTTNSGFSGSINLSGGAVVVGSGASIGSGNITMGSNTSLTVSSGATSITLSGAITVAAGSSATLASGQLGNEFSGALTSGDNTSVLNLGGGCSFNGSASSQFSGFNGTVNIPSGSTLRFAVQSSGNKFGSLNPNFIINGTLQPRNAGNTVTLGTLNGSGQLTGPQTAGTGSGATLYIVGGNNQNGNFSGTIVSNASSAGSAICFDKTGAGTQVLGGNNTMTGTNAVQAGTLLLNGSNIPSLLTVFSAATLGGTGTINGPIVVNSGGILSPGAGTGNVGTLTLGSNLSLTSPTLNFDLSSSPSGPNDQIVMNGGALNMTGTQTYQFNLLNGALNNGTYVLITGATNDSAASFAINLPSGARQTFAMQSPAANTGAGYVWLVVSGSPAASLVWQGTNGNNWDTSTINWLNGPSADTFFNLDVVQFDDTSTNGNISVVGTLQPAQVTAENFATTYMLSGTGVLTGGMLLVQNGGGNFILNNTNTYTGGTALNSGEVTVSNTTAVGSGPIIFNGGEFNFAGPALSIYSNLLIFAGNSSIASTGGGNNTVSSSWVGTNVTVNMNIPSGIFSVTGSMSPFSGTVELGNSAGSFRFNLGTPSTYDCSRIAFDLGTNSAQLLNRNGNTVITLGSLAGGPNTSLRGAGSVTNFQSTYVIGSNNLSTIFAGSIIDGTPVTAQTIIEKVGNGTWTLTGASTFGGGMTVSSGTLLVDNTSGSATGEGPLEIMAGATLTGTGIIDSASTLDDYSYLAPGDTTGTLTFTSDLTLNDNTILSFGLGTNSDSVAVGGDLFLTGQLQVSDAGGFGPGTYTLFTCAGTVTFDNFTLASAPPGFNYAITTNNSGTVSLVVTPPTPPVPPSINSISVNGGNLVLSGSGGVTNGTFYVLTATNLTTPLSNWTPLLTNQFDSSGNFNLTNPVDLTVPQSFYLLQLP